VTHPTGSADSGTGPARRPATVIYLAGSGRSGSTLLERTIAAIPGTATVGELLDLPRKVAPHDEMCGCGVAFSRCPFWAAVGERAFGGWDPELLRETHRLQARVARQRHLPRLLTALAGSSFGRAVTEYGERYGRLVRAVAEEAGAQYVVDASKWPALALALHRGGVDLRVIHLVRDVRGVAHSLSQPDIARPHATGATDLMFHNSPAGGAARWLATQTEVDLIRARGVRVARLSYAEFVRAPGPALGRALAELEVPVPPGGLGHIDGSTVRLGPSHGLSGNPSRFRHGATELRPDDRWRTQMSRRDRWAAAAIGLPQLLRLNAATRPSHPADRPPADAPSRAVETSR
jgi:hypothetical protein